MSETSVGTVTGRALSRELGRMLASIRREHDRLAKRGRDLPSGADWLLDNWYLIEREGKLAASELRRAGRLRASMRRRSVCQERLGSTAAAADRRSPVKKTR